MGTTGSYFALFCAVHSQIAQDSSIWRVLHFVENPTFFLVLILFLFSSAILRCLIFSEKSTILLHTQETAVMKNHVETLKTIWILFTCRHISSKY